MPEKTESKGPNRNLPMSIMDAWMHHGCIGKLWNTYIVEYFSALKGNEFLPCAAMWMSCEDIVQSEMSQTPNAHLVWLHLDEVPGKVKCIEKTGE
jgi:hypothetical protein